MKLECLQQFEVGAFVSQGLRVHMLTMFFFVFLKLGGVGGDECRGDLWKKNGSKSEREDLQDCSQTCYDVWFRNSGATKKTTGRAAEPKIDG